MCVSHCFCVRSRYRARGARHTELFVLVMCMGVCRLPHPEFQSHPHVHINGIATYQ